VADTGGWGRREGAADDEARNDEEDVDPTKPPGSNARCRWYSITESTASARMPSISGL